ncbi:MAG: DUF1444 family protein, partial [Planctomycetes bacterium]|nr:DUF1444 family protein [Planctomycetota bacterium]
TLAEKDSRPRLAPVLSRRCGFFGSQGMGLIDRFLGPARPDRFAQQLISAMRQAGDPRSAVYDPAEFQLKFYDGEKEVGIASLRNLYDEYCKVPRNMRRHQMRHVVRALLSYHKELPEEFADAQCDLRPMVRTRSYFDMIRLQQEAEGNEGPNIPYQPIGDHLAASLVYDLPESMRTISQDSLDDWGITYYEAMEAARRNLEEAEFRFAGIDERVYASVTGDNYDASRLLLTDLIRKLSVQGDHVAVVPNRDSLLIAGADDEQGLAILAELADKALEEPRPMCAIPMRLDGDEWVPWFPPPGHPLTDKFRLLEVKSLYGEYADQKPLLDAVHEKQGVDVFVATYSAIEKESGEVMSYCVWSKGVDAYLPKTQKVMFVEEGQQELIGGDWDAVQRVVGRLMAPVEDLYPPRWRVRDFPSAAELEQLRDKSL